MQQRRRVPREPEGQRRLRGADAGHDLVQAAGFVERDAVDRGQAVVHFDETGGLENAPPPVRSSRKGLYKYLIVNSSDEFRMGGMEKGGRAGGGGG